MVANGGVGPSGFRYARSAASSRRDVRLIVEESRAGIRQSKKSSYPREGGVEAPSSQGQVQSRCSCSVARRALVAVSSGDVTQPVAQRLGFSAEISPSRARAAKNGNRAWVANQLQPDGVHLAVGRRQVRQAVAWCRGCTAPRGREHGGGHRKWPGQTLPDSVINAVNDTSGPEGSRLRHRRSAEGASQTVRV